jgi:hypothetical protein
MKHFDIPPGLTAPRAHAGTLPKATGFARAVLKTSGNPPYGCIRRGRC